MISLTAQPAREPFPFKREFLDPEMLWNNIINMNLAVPKVVQPEERWRTIPRNMRWVFQGKTVAFIVDENAYELVNKLVDYFSEEARMHARRKD